MISNISYYFLKAPVESTAELRSKVVAEFVVSKKLIFKAKLLPFFVYIELLKQVMIVVVFCSNIVSHFVTASSVLAPGTHRRAVQIQEICGGG